MKTIAAVFAVLLAATPVRAAAPAETNLRQLGDKLLSLSDQDYRDMVALPEVSGKDWAKRSRTELLGLTYRRLAALRYRAALDAGLDPELKPQAESALGGLTTAGRAVSDDAKAASPDADLLQNTGYWDSFSSYMNQSSVQNSRSGYRPAAVAAVRGGRKLSTEDDKETTRLLASVDSADKALEDEATTPSKRAQIHFEAGRTYEKVAAIAAKPAPAAAVEPAPAPAAKTLSAKEIYEADAKSVVLILAGTPSGSGELGTGSVIDASGRVLTNAHVVIDDRTGRPYPSVRVYLKPAKITGDSKRDMADPIATTVARYDRALDLAVLELARAPRVPVLTLGDDAGVETGDPVVAIGHPEQGGLWTLTQGVISTVIADLGGVPGKNAFQTDASINRGNSGGPLIDRTGAIVGVNTSMARKAADGLTITSVNFSIKSSVARAWLDGSAPNAAAAAPAAEDSAPAAAPAAPVAAAPAAPAAPLPPAPKTKPAMLTPAKPYRIDDVLAREMKEMEDLGDEMHEEIMRRSAPKAP